MEHPRNIIKCAFDALIVTGSWIQLTWLIRILRYIVDPATAKSLDQRLFAMRWLKRRYFIPRCLTSVLI